MTGTPFDDDLAGVETMLRDRFDTAVGGLTPDIGRLVADGAAEGRGTVRRRRIVSGLAAAAVAVVAIGGISLATQTDLFGKGDHATNNGELQQLVPATPRGMTAALLSHTDPLELGTRLAVGGTKSTPDHLPEISGQVAYDLGDGKGVEIDVFATQDLSQVDPSSCGGVSAATGFAVCRPITLTDADHAWYVEYGSDALGDTKTPTALSAVIAVRSDELVAVLETMNGTTDYALGQDALAAIVADPAVGMSTTDAFNTAGNEIPDFKDNGLTTTESDNGSSSGGGSSGPKTTHTSTPRSGSADASGSGRSN
jgi:hypothetical protein